MTPSESLALISARRKAALEALSLVSPDLERQIAEAGCVLSEAIRSGHRVFACGNGGSASDAQHFVAELVGRYQAERAPIAATAFSADSSTVTALSNDYGFEAVFERQVEAWVKSGDVLVVISTSGTSQNVILAAREAKRRGGTVIGLTGRSGGELAPACDVPIQMPVDETPRIQELHIHTLHTLVELAEPR